MNSETSPPPRPASNGGASLRGVSFAYPSSAGTPAFRLEVEELSLAPGEAAACSANKRKRVSTASASKGSASILPIEWSHKCAEAKPSRTFRGPGSRRAGCVVPSTSSGAART